MSKFKIGDKVIRVDAAGGFEEFKVGEVRTVEDVGDDWFSPAPGRVLTDKRAELFEEAEDTPTAESLRSRYLLSKQEAKAYSINIQNLEKEQEEIVAQLKEMGFSLYEAPVNEERISFPTIVKDVVQEIDYSDPTNWKKGMFVECVNSNGWGADFVEGGVYKVLSGFVAEWGVLIDSEKHDRCINKYLSDFKFHSIGTYKCDA